VPLDIRENVPLAPRTTFELGGPARYFADVATEQDVVAALSWAADGNVPVFVLGGGSNMVVADEGFRGLVLHVAGRGVRFEPAGDRVVVVVAAGEPWDLLVARSVERNLAGLECLSGIPGLAGATPIQNVGAYGQEVSETILRVRAFDRRVERVVDIAPSDCGFAYRDSAFKADPSRFIVLEVSFGLTKDGAPAVRYGELERALEGAREPSIARVRETILGLRRAKSMVLDPSDENRRSAGSFFTNPIVDDAVADAVVARALRERMVDDPAKVPRYPAGRGRTKLAAGWLIERAGIAKGMRRGHVGVSTKHALALVHHGGGTTGELLELARHVRDTVKARFGVTLVPEPVLLGCSL
jgi:UDP-N-acetylmuramate dehydrogenase